MIKPSITLDTVRQFILDEVVNSGRDISLKTLSIAAGKNPAYIHQFIYRGSPRHLPEDVRHKIASMLGVSEYSLRPQSDTLNRDNTLIQYLDHPSQHAYSDGPWHVPHSFLSDTLHIKSTDIRLAVVGDCPADFGISSGDIIMMNLQDKNPLIAGYFALNAGDHIRVRHLEQVSLNDNRIVINGNGPNAYATDGADNDILGRVIFHAQIFSNQKFNAKKLNANKSNDDLHSSSKSGKRAES